MSIENVSDTNTDISKVIHLAFAFTLLFTAYSTTQTLITTLFGNTGFISLGILYFSLSISSFFVPQVIHKIGIHYSLIFSSCSYVLFIILVLIRQQFLFWITSAILGIGASILWVAQGSYIALLAKNKKDVIGKYTGTFFGIYNISNLLGYVIASVIFRFTTNENFIIFVFACIGIIAVFIFMKLPKLDESSIQSTQTGTSITFKLMKTLEILKFRTMQIFLLNMIIEGMLQTFTGGVFSSALGWKKIPSVFLCYGLAIVIGSFIWGRFYDISWKILIALQLILTLIGQSIVFHAFTKNGNYILLLIGGLIFGLNDGLCANLNSSTLIELFQEDAPNAIAVFKAISSLSRALSYFYFPKFGFYAIQRVVVASVGIACSTYIVMRTLL